MKRIALFALPVLLSILAIGLGFLVIRARVGVEGAATEVTPPLEGVER